MIDSYEKSVTILGARFLLLLMKNTKTPNRFRRNVVSMAAELKQVKDCLVSQEQFFVNKTLSRKEKKTKIKNMEREICKLHKTLEDRNCQLEASSSAATKVLCAVRDVRIVDP
ncbi:hypothetical protein Bca52824_087503 [Brassica carinata]|uniref:Uncharacterized protein n=1 Tax=Brassica carinata TaxID=52824 RepID=A0A8X7TMU7_BRACI|nr:hypothetical protein Bca52824_087503 [Brassica carinata]